MSPATLVLRDLPAGRYALTALHDEDGNGRLGINMLGSNVEPVGFSNDAFGNAASPSFDKAALGGKGWVFGTALDLKAGEPSSR